MFEVRSPRGVHCTRTSSVSLECDSHATLVACTFTVAFVNLLLTEDVWDAVFEPTDPVCEFL